MLSSEEIYTLGNASIIAPAGYGKTQVIAEIAALGERTLILTHTHAGVAAIRKRLKKLSVSSSKVVVDTIAGWSMRYAHAFPKVACPPAGMPKGGEWDQLYSGVIEALDISAVREVIWSSYDRILIDEYQDCPQLQHNLAVKLSTIVSTTIFGDPMQGIFEFAGATLSWENDIYPHFPLASELEIPHRWAETNPELGNWISEAREKLVKGEQIDLQDPRIDFRVSDNAFDMGVMFDGIDTKAGTFAAIHCNKGICYKLASVARGGYQAIEELGAKRLNEFADEWDGAATAEAKKDSITSLLADSFNKRPLGEGEVASVEEQVIVERMRVVANALVTNGDIDAARELVSLCRKHPRWRLYRSGLWRDAERSIQELASGRYVLMSESVGEVRQRMIHAGRHLPGRTVSTPLLLKGLEFDHVIVPHATHFSAQTTAQAKLFYVAISRATTSLTISSPTRYVQFEKPKF